MTRAGVLDAEEADAAARDAADTAGLARDRFVLPSDRTDSPYGELAYLAGNSLGPQPVDAGADVAAALAAWASLAVDGHRLGARPWSTAADALRAPMARVVGALDDEVVVMNTLTANLHFLLASFYTPTAARHRIVIEAAAFPSDAYAVTSHARFRGYDDAVVRLSPRPGERCLTATDVVEYLEREADRTCLVLLGGINYLTGELMDMKTITDAARRLGITIGWDLAHAAGNVVCDLHDLGADFAAWCTYKYLNGGPGSIAAAFIHERHLGDETIARLSGWWSNDPSNRFEMLAELTPMATADAWAVSNPPILSMAPLRSALQVFDDVSIAAVRARSVRLTGYLEELLTEAALDGRAAIVTPKDPAARGCQLSISVRGDHHAVAAAMGAVDGVACDVRSPDIVRLAPAPLFCTYHDCWRAARALEGALR